MNISKTDLYKVWAGMKQRCYNHKFPHYHRYGGRGIEICERWLNSFENFKSDMEDGYVKGVTTIERIDNDGNYSPDNCKWATRKEQAQNRLKAGGAPPGENHPKAIISDLQIKSLKKDRELMNVKELAQKYKMSPTGIYQILSNTRRNKN